MQPSLFSQATHAPKAVRETSREAYAEILPTIKGRQLAVLTALDFYLTTSRGRRPTSSELMRYMGATDPNSVRPRLSEMGDESCSLRYVEASEQPRKCSVTGKKAHTWALTARGAAYLRGLK